MMYNKTITLNVNLTDEVMTVKQKILEKEGIPVNSLRLIYEGKQMENGKTLKEHNICTEATVHLTLLLKGGHKLLVRPVVKKNKNCRIGYYNMRQSIDKPGRLENIRKIIGANKFNILTMAEPLLTKKEVKYHNDNIPMNSKYIELWSLDEEKGSDCKNRTVGHGLVTFLHINTGYKDYLKIICSGYIHAISLPTANELNSQTILIHVYIPVKTKQNKIKREEIMFKLDKFLRENANKKLIVQGDINEIYLNSQSKNKSRRINVGSKLHSIFQKYNLKDITITAHTNSVKEDIRATRIVENNWSQIDVTLTNFNDKICDNYIINKSNSIFPFNSDHCLIAADFDAIDLLGWLPGEGMEPIEVVKYDIDEIKRDEEKIEQQYQNEEDFLEIEAMAKEILQSERDKAYKIKLLNRMNDMLNEIAEKTLEPYILITKRGSVSEMEKKMAEEIINNEKKYDDIFARIDKSKNDLIELSRIKNEMEAAEKAYNIAAKYHINEYFENRSKESNQRKYGKAAKIMRGLKKGPILVTSSTTRYEGNDAIPTVAKNRTEVLEQIRFDHEQWTATIVNTEEEIKNAAPEMYKRANEVEEAFVKNGPCTEKYAKELKTAMEADITNNELEELRKGIKTGKAAGPSGIPAEFYKIEGVFKRYRTLLRCTHFLETIPDAWRLSNKWCLPKKLEEQMSLKNCRPLALLEILYKTYENFIKNRIVWIFEKYNIIHDTQNGFRYGRSTFTSILNLITTIRDAHMHKKEIHIALADMAKAFDSPEIWGLNRIYKMHKLPEKLINIFKDMGTNIESRIISTAHGLTRKYRIGRGVFQGAVLSPFKWDLVLNPVLWHLNSNLSYCGYTIQQKKFVVNNKGNKIIGENEEIVEIETGENNIVRNTTKNIKKKVCEAFADDTALMAKNRRSIITLFQVFSAWCAIWGIAVNGAKTVIHALYTDDTEDFEIATLHKCWFRIGKRKHNSNIEENEGTMYGPKICGCSVDGDNTKYKIIKEIVKYENYTPYKKLAEYKKGDKVYIDANEVEDFERVGTDRYFTAKRDILTQETMMYPTTEDEDKWEPTMHRYLGIYINFLDNINSSRRRVEKKLERAFYIIANKRFTIFETHLNIRGVLQAIFGYTAAVTPFARHILTAWDRDMQLALARKVGIRIDIMRWSRLTNASFVWGGFEISSFLTLQTVVQYRLYKRTQTRPDRNASFSLKVLYNSCMQEANTWGKYTAIGDIPLAILTEMSKQQHANPLAIYMIGIRQHGLNLYEKNKLFSIKEQFDQEISTVWAYKKEYFMEGVARENAFREKVEREWNAQFNFSPKQRQRFVAEALKKYRKKLLRNPELQYQLLINRQFRTRKTEDVVDHDNDICNNNTTHGNNNTTKVIRIGTDASLRHTEFGTVIKIAVVVDAKSDDMEMYIVPEAEDMIRHGYKLYKNYTTPSEKREEILKNENDIFKYGFPPPRDIWVRTHQYLCTTTWDIGIGEQFGINMAIKLPYNIEHWGDNLNSINDSNLISAIVKQELEDGQNYILDENMKEVPQETVALQKLKEIIRWRRKNNLLETLAHCRSHGNGWDDDPEKRQSKEVTYLNHYADLMCDTKGIKLQDVKYLAPRNISTNWLYVGIQGEEIKDPAKFMIKVKQIQSDLKIQSYRRPTAIAFMRNQVAGNKIGTVQINNKEQHLQNFLHRLKAYSLPTRTRNHNYGKRGDRRNGSHYKCLASGCSHDYANQEHFMHGECRSTHNELQLWPIRVCNKLIMLAPRGWPFMRLKGVNGGWNQHSFKDVWKHLMTLKLDGEIYNDTYDMENYGNLDKKSTKWSTLKLRNENVNNNTIAWIKTGLFLYRIYKKGTLDIHNNVILTPIPDHSQNDGIVSVIAYCINIEDTVIFVNPKHKLKVANIHNWLEEDPRFHILKDFAKWNWISIYDNIKHNYKLTNYNEIIEQDNSRYITKLNIANIRTFKRALFKLHGPTSNGKTRREFLKELDIQDPFQALNYGGVYEGQANECSKYSHYSLHDMVMSLFTLGRWGQDMKVEDNIKHTSVYTRQGINFGNELAATWIYTYKCMFRDFANETMTHPDKVESKQLRLDKAERDKATRMVNIVQRHSITCQLGGCDKAVTGMRSNKYCTKHLSISFVKNNYQLMYTEISASKYGNIHPLLREYYITIGRCQFNKSLGESYRCPAPVGTKQCYCKLHAINYYNVRCNGVGCRNVAKEDGKLKGFCSTLCKATKTEIPAGPNTRLNAAKTRKSMHRRGQRLQNKLLMIQNRREYRNEYTETNRDTNLHIMINRQYTKNTSKITRCLGGDGGINIMYVDTITNLVEVTVPADGNCLFNSMETVRYGKVRKERRNRDARARLYNWLIRHSDKQIQGITLRDWIKSATNENMDINTYCKQRIHNKRKWGGGIEIAAYAIQFEATVTIWIKVNDYNGKRAAYQRISYFLPPGRIRYKLHLVWANRNHYNALLNVPHDA